MDNQGKLVLVELSGKPSETLSRASSCALVEEELHNLHCILAGYLKGYKIKLVREGNSNCVIIINNRLYKLIFKVKRYIKHLLISDKINIINFWIQIVKRM